MKKRAAAAAEDARRIVRKRIEWHALLDRIQCACFCVFCVVFLKVASKNNKTKAQNSKFVYGRAERFYSLLTLIYKHYLFLRV